MRVLDDGYYWLASPLIPPNPINIYHTWMAGMKSTSALLMNFQRSASADMAPWAQQLPQYLRDINTKKRYGREARLRTGGCAG